MNAAAHTLIYNPSRHSLIPVTESARRQSKCRKQRRNHTALPAIIVEARQTTVEQKFKQSGLTISISNPVISANKVWVAGHQGPHPAEYHKEVFGRLFEATRDKLGDAYTQAFQKELTKIGKEIQTPGTRLNDLVTKK